ncbi:MAG: hypothetical protein E6R03_06945 [Hyphomicrobiaceae bacterium]|nr:MAG: hypothetical protein E6R03_06945 [Hyphomicrobiaceae bacterium]
MPNDNQAQADAADETTVVDPLDVTNSTNSGTNELDAYEQERQAFLNGETNDTTHGDEPADEVEDSTDEDAGDSESEEEDGEETSEETSEDQEEGEEQDDATDVKTQERFRFKDDEDKAIAALAKARGITLREATKAYEALTAGDQTQQQNAETKTADTSPDKKTAASVLARIEELDALEAEAYDSLELETAKEHRKEANRLRNELIDLKIAEMQEKSRTDADAERKFYTEYAASESKAITFYPDLKDPNHPLTKRVAELDAQARELEDPNYHSENKPWLLATAAAKELGILMKKPDSATSKKKTVQSRPIQPVSGSARTSTADTNQKFEADLDKVETLDDYERLVGRA